MEFRFFLFFIMGLLIASCDDKSFLNEVNHRALNNGSIKLLETKASFTFNSEMASSSMIICPVIINNKPASFGIDTGLGDYPIISESAAIRIGITNIDYTINGQFGSTKITGPVKFTIGPFVIAQPRIGIVPDRFNTVDGLFGFSILKHFKLNLNPKKNTITLSLNTDKLPDSINLLPRSDGKIRLKVNILGKDRIAVLDTGNSEPNRISKNFELAEYKKSSPLKVTEYSKNTQVAASGGALSDLFALVEIETKIPSVPQPINLKYWVTNNLLDESYINLGMDFFSRYNITIDYYNWTISIE